MDLYYYSRARDKVRDKPGASFCEKLNYIADQKFLGFEFMKGTRSRSLFGDSFTSSIQLFDDGKSRIDFVSEGHSYVTYFPVLTDAAEANKKFEALEAATVSCVPGFSKRVKTADQVSDYDRKTFVRQVVFLNMGTLPFNVNKYQTNSKIKHTLTIKLLKKDEQYAVTYEIE